MISAHRAHRRRVIRFRTKLLAAIMLVVSAIMAFGLYLAQRNVTAAALRDLQQNFKAELFSLHKMQEFRNATLPESPPPLPLMPRIHPALENNALDPLYPNSEV